MNSLNSATSIGLSRCPTPADANLEFGHPSHQTLTVHGTPSKIFLTLLIGLVALGTTIVRGQIPTTLTDKIYQGSGSIDLLKDVSATSLQQYLTGNGKLILGADLNENASGNENSDSVGVAIKQLKLVLATTAGTFSFSDFWTSTTANIRESGTTAANQFYTMFGKGGSSAINGGTASFDVSRFDDVVELRNIAFTGTIHSAQLNVAFLNTAKTSTQGNETFFDYSGGFEDFALIGRTEAYALEIAAAGLNASPSGVSYTAETVAAPVTVTSDPPTPTPTPTPTAPGAPAPPIVVLAAMGALVVWKSRRNGQ